MRELIGRTKLLGLATRHSTTEFHSPRFHAIGRIRKEFCLTTVRSVAKTLPTLPDGIAIFEGRMVSYLARAGRSFGSYQHSLSDGIELNRFPVEFANKAQLKTSFLKGHERIEPFREVAINESLNDQTVIRCNIVTRLSHRYRLNSWEPPYSRFRETVST